MSPYPRADIEEQIVAPGHKAEKSQGIGQEPHVLEETVVVDVVAESREGQDQRKRSIPPLQATVGEDTQQKEFKESEREPVAPLGGPETGEEQWRRGQEQEEDDRGHYLHLELADDRLSHRPPHAVEQPSADEEEARQAEEEEHIVPPHPLVAKTIVADVGIDHKDHRESPHGIDVLYPLLTHSDCKITKSREQNKKNSFFFIAETE